MDVVTRFAPSPTGFLHIGGARTALFNWLFARHHGGRFLLRIEDTDRARSTDAAVTAIHEGLKWLGLDWDGDAVSQFEQADRHRAIAQQLLDTGQAYHCYCTPEELREMRDKARAEGRSTGYGGRWRDRDPADAPAGVDPVVRLKAPRDGETFVDDSIQGTVKVANSQLDDMILLRADGSPTYMLAVVVDDHDMAITHVIRGDDHLTNTFRQRQIYDALGWTPPQFAHQSLIHSPDGGKLSKRHGALGVDAYRDMGFLPAAMRNYLVRLGWSHGDDEIISTEQAIEWFNLEAVGRAPARFDMAKATALNGHYIREADDGDLTDLVLDRLPGLLGTDPVPETADRLRAAMTDLKPRAKNLVELAESALFYARPRPLAMTDKAAKQLTPDALALLGDLAVKFAAVADWDDSSLSAVMHDVVESRDVKFGKVAQPLRAALTGTNVSPSITAVMAVLGRDDSLGRIQDAIGA